MMLEPGAIGTLRLIFLLFPIQTLYQSLAKSTVYLLTLSFCRVSYQHHNINEPAFLLGVAFPEEKR